MVLELRAIKGAVVAFLLALGLVFLPWEFVFPAFAVAYGAWKTKYHGDRVGVYTGEAERLALGRWLVASTLAFLVLFLGALGVKTLFPGNWSSGLAMLYEGVAINLSAPGALTQTLIPIIVFTGLLVVPLLALAYVGSQLRQRLLTGLHSREAALRAAIWESLVRVPIYLLWASVFTVPPAYKTWKVVPNQIGSALGGNGTPGPPDPSPLLPANPIAAEAVFSQAGSVLHLVPVVLVGAFFAVRVLKYGDDSTTIPEVLGYRGLYPASRSPSIAANVVVPVALYLVFAGGVVLYNGLAVVDALLWIAVVVAVVMAADLRGTTTRFATGVGDGLPGVAGDAVVVGLVGGAYAMAGLTVTDVIVGVLPDFTVAGALLLPVVAVPLGYGANRATGRLKTDNIEEMIERVEADPSAIENGDIDRLLAYVRARDDDLRSTALEGLAIAAGASTYREDEALAEFVAAIRIEDEEFARPALQGVVELIRGERVLETLDRLTEEDILRAVEYHLDGQDRRTRELAVEAYSLIVGVGYTSNEVERPPLGEVEDLPIARIEEILGEEPADEALTSAVVTAFAHLWYTAHRAPDETRYARADLSTTLTAEDEQRLLVDLVRYAEFADERARGVAAFALTSDDAVVESEGLETVLDAVDSEEPLVRYVAAHVLESSMARHANRIAADRVLTLLDDPDAQARGQGAEVVYAFVEAASEDRRREVVEDIVGHLAGRDPAEAGTAEAALLRAVELIPAGHLVEYPDATATVADYVGSEDPVIAEPAARVLATLVDVDPDLRTEEGVMAAIEGGLTHESPEVREHCVAAAASVIAVSPDEGRPFVGGLVLNLNASGTVGEMAISCLSRVLDEYPGYGTEVLPEMVGGLNNPTPVSRQYAGAMIAGKNVSEVTAELVGEVTEEGVSRGDNLIGPLVNLSGNVGGATREAVFQALANLSEEYPEQSREAIGAVAGALDEGSVRVRRNAARLLANVAEVYPAAIEPVVEKLALAIDDSDTRTRATALSALDRLAEYEPAAIGGDVRRIIGRLDDDSSIVREHAAEVVVTLAERDPGLVDPAAEASDRLRRLQRDPAVDIEGETLQSAASAVQTGTPAGEAEAGGPADEETRVWNVEDADEAGSSGDTRVFDPMEGGEEFEGDIDEAEFDFDDAAPAGPGSEGDGDDETIIMEDADGDDDGGDEAGETIIMEPGDEGTGEEADATSDEDGETIIMDADEAGDGEADATSDEDGETIIMEPGDASGEGGDEDDETIIMDADDAGGQARDEDGDDGGDETGETIIMSGDDPDGGSDEDDETIIMETAGERDDAGEGDDEDEETIIMESGDDGGEDGGEDETIIMESGDADPDDGGDEDDETIIMDTDDDGSDDRDGATDASGDEDEETIIMSGDDDGEDAGTGADDAEGDETAETIVMSGDGDDEGDDGDD